MDEPRRSRRIQRIEETAGPSNRTLAPENISSSGSRRGRKSPAGQKRKTDSTNETPKSRRSVKKAKQRIPEQESERQDMNETVDYVAMVEQHLSDEAMARRLQEQENSNRIISPQNPSISARLEAPNPLPFIAISSDEEEDEMNEADLNLDEEGLASLEDAMDEMAERDELARPLDFDDSWDDDEMEDELPVRRNAVLVHRGVGGGDAGPARLFGSFRPGSVQVHINGRPASLNPIINPFARISGNRESLSSYESALHAAGLDESFESRFLSRILAHSADSFEPPSTGLNAAQLNRLPSSTATAATTDKSCTICMENYEVGGSIRTLPCFHFFHIECVDPWLKRNEECPVCRASAKRTSA